MLRVIGAGLPRTGTMSLKVALERLLGAPCYHMLEVFAHPEHVPAWHQAARGQMPDWNDLLTGYAAAVDWPASAFWPELSATYPEALVILSVRDAQSWWNSANETIIPNIRKVDLGSEWRMMVDALFATRLKSEMGDREACIAAFERHNARVRETVSPQRMLEWNASEGWQPLCAALGVPVPEEPFPHTNTREEFVARLGSGPHPSAGIKVATGEEE